MIESQGSALALDWLQLPPAEGFAALAALPQEAKRRLFAWCIASTLKPQLAIEDRANPVLESAGHRLAIPFADLWRPTAVNYWGRVKKAHGLDTGREILGQRWARDHVGDKKPVLAAALETAFDPAKSAACIGLGQAARDEAAAWLPPGMAFASSDGESGSSGARTEIDGGERTGADPGPAALPAFLIEEDDPAAPDSLPIAAE